MPISRTILTLGLCAAVLGGSFSPALAETLRIGGTGAATGMIPLLSAAIPPGEDFALEAIPSLGTSGGLQAVEDGVLDIAVAGRALKPEEQARGLTQVAAFRTPFVLVTSHRQPNEFNSAGIAGIFSAPNPTWPDGSPIRIILRPKSDSDTPVLGAMFPDMVAAIDTARRRPEIPVAATDQDNLDMAEKLSGSLAGSSLTQIQTEQRKLRLVTIDGVEPSLEALESGKYPFSKTLYVVLSAKKKPAADRFVAYLNSPSGQRVLRETGNLLLRD